MAFTRLEVRMEEEMKLESRITRIQNFERSTELIRRQQLQVVDQMKRVIPNGSSFLSVLEMKPD